MKAKLFGQKITAQGKLIAAAIPNFRLIGNSLIVREGLESRLSTESERKFEARAELNETITKDVPVKDKERLTYLDENGIVRVGTNVGLNDILVGKVRPRRKEEYPSPEEQMLAQLFDRKALNENTVNISVIYPYKDPGIVIDTKYEPILKGKKNIREVGKRAEVYVTVIKTLSIGDILQDQKENKGVVSSISQVPIRLASNQRPLDILIDLDSDFVSSLEEVQEYNVFAAPNGEFFLYPANTNVENGYKLVGKGKAGTIDLSRQELYREDKMCARSTGRYYMISQQPIIEDGGAKITHYQMSALQSYPEIAKDAIIFRGDNKDARNNMFMEVVKSDKGN
jgi:hypothetical protein